LCAFIGHKKQEFLCYNQSMAKHFLKTLLIFIGMIALGLVSIFLISYFNKGENGENLPVTADIAK